MKRSIFFSTAWILIFGVYIANTNLLAQRAQPHSFSDTEKQEIIAFHNKVRSEVGAPPLEWSDELASFALEWSLYLASTGCRLQHRPRDNSKWAQKYGENIFWGMGKSYSGVDACRSWASEKKFWKGGKISPKNWSKSGHYTQMVWAKSTKIGLAKVVCPNGATIIVGNYDPVGNMMGESPY